MSLHAWNLYTGHVSPISFISKDELTLNSLSLILSDDSAAKRVLSQLKRIEPYTVTLWCISGNNVLS